MKNFYNSAVRLSLVMATLLSSVSFAQTTLISPTAEGGFELAGGFAGNGWTVVNHTTNLWQTGSASVAAGTTAAYISNDGGITNNYTNTISQTSHFYRDVTIPAGESVIQLNFAYQGYGESGFDRLLVYTAGTGVVPVAGTPASTSTVLTGGTLIYLSPIAATFQNVALTLPPALAGTSVRLIFTWQNDGSVGTNPGGTIDNISLTSMAPAPLNGIYTIDNTLPTSGTIPASGGNFNSFTAAINYMNLNGISGPVTFNVIAGETFTEAPQTITATGTLANPIIFQRSGAGANPLLLVTNGTGFTDGGFTIAGGDYYTFDGIDVTDNPANTTSTTRAEYGYFIKNASATDGAQFNTIKNTKITMNRTYTTSRAILQNVTTAPTAASGANSNNSFLNLTIRNVFAGIQLNGNFTFPDLITEIGTTSCTTYNSIGDPATANDIGNSSGTTYGINATNQSDFKIHNNIIRNVTNLAGQADGINIVSFRGVSAVYNNKIQGIKNASTTSTTVISGIRATHSTTGTHTLRIYNNAISDILSAYTSTATTTRTIKGIYISGTGGTTTQTYEVYDNSVSIDGTASLNLSSVDFEVASTTGPLFIVRNNVFANFTAAQGATAKHFTIATPTAGVFGPAGSSSNNNDLYIANDAGVSGFIGTAGANTYATLANWQAGITTPAGIDAASVSVNPSYINNSSDLHATNIALNASGMAPPAYITLDLECASRASDNDIGAFIITACAGTPTAGTITGASAVCSGLGTTLTLTGASNTAGITYQWASSTVSGGPYTNMGTSGTQATGPLTSTTYYVVTSTCSVSGLSATTPQFTVSINPNPVVSVTPTSGTICNPGGTAVSLTGSGASTYSWGPATGLSATTGTTVSANPAVTTTYTVTGTDALGCVGTSNATITVSTNPSVSVTATPVNICTGGNSQLLATAAVTSSYSVTNIPYAPIPTPGSGVTTLSNAGAIVVPLNSGNLDDGGWSDQTIPFTLNFFGVNYTTFGVSTNGFVFLGSGPPNTYTGYGNAFPSTFAAHPSIGALYADDDFRFSGVIEYFTVGTAPNRMLVVNFTNGQFFSGSGALTTQVIIYEGSNIIEVHTNNSTSHTGVEGIQDAPGTTAYTVTGRNNGTFSVTTPDAYRFAPVLGSYTYSWSPGTFLSSTTINNPMANAMTSSVTYTVTATSALGCANSGTVTVNVGTPLGNTLTVAPAASVCAGTNVSFTSAPTGGGEPYTYSWTGPSGFTSTLQNPTITGATVAASGTYSLTVTDACGGSITNTISLTVHPLPVVSVTPSNALICNPGGSPVTLTATGASTYSWAAADGLSSTTGATVTGYPTSSSNVNYIVTGTDSFGCSSSDTANVVVGNTVTVTSVSASPNPLCFGSNTVLTAAGSSALSYCDPVYSSGTNFGDYITNVTLGTINNSTGASTSPFVTYYSTLSTNLTAGSAYTLTGTINNGGTEAGAAWIDFNQNGVFEASEKLGEQTTLSFSFPFTVPLTAVSGVTRMRVMNVYFGSGMTPCGSYTWGEVEDYNVNIIGGSAVPMTYSWSPSTFLASTTGASVNANGVNAATTYSVTLTNSSGCSATDSVAVTLNPLPLATLNDTVVCTGTGSYVINAQNAGDTYLWNTGATTQTVTVFSGGLYYVDITSPAGCTKRDSMNLTLNIAPYVNLGPDAAFCTGDSLTLDAGNSGMNFLWNTTATTQTINALTGGAYSVTVTNPSNSCSTSDTIAITVNPLPVVNLGADTAICNGNSLVLDAGNAGSTYAWSDASTSQTLTVTTSGTYSVTVTNPATTCVNSDAITVTVNPIPVVALGADTAICSNSPLVLDAGNAGATYLWNDASTLQTLTVTATGTYSVTVTNAFSCSVSDAINIIVNPVPVVNIGPDSAQCGGTITMDAGNTGSTFMWNDASTSQTLTASTSGNYYVTVTDLNGCSTSDSAMLAINPIPVLNLVDTTQCGGSVTLDAGNPGLSYLWNNSTTNQTLTVFLTGTYSVTVTDTVTGCFNMDSALVTIKAQPIVDLGADTTQCGGTITLDAGPGYTSYNWYCSFCTGQTLVVNATGTYQVMVGNGTGCFAYDTINVVINTLPAVGMTPFSTVCLQAPPFTLVNGMPAGGVYSGTGVSGGMFDPSVAGVGSFPITYTITDANGCSNSASQNATVQDCAGVEEYSAFQGLSIYPNPTSGMFSIAVSNANFNELQISITDIQGKEVYRETDKNISNDYVKPLNLEDLAKGIYYIRLTAGTELKVAKLIIQ